MSNPDPTTRRWRLRGYDEEKTCVHDQTVTGDAALNTALTRLEADPDIARTTAAAL